MTATTPDLEVVGGTQAPVRGKKRVNGQGGATLAPRPDQETLVKACDDFVQLQREYIATSEAYLTTTTAYTLASYFADEVPWFPTLCFASAMPVSGKTTAGAHVVQAGNFSKAARQCERASRAAAVREVSKERKGMRIEDVHKFDENDDIFLFLTNRFPRDGVHIVADLKDQGENVSYDIGGTAFVITTNNLARLDQDVRRRSIVLSMIRGTPQKYTDNPDWKPRIEAVRAVLARAAKPADGFPEIAMPEWMDEGQRQRWLGIFKVVKALLSPAWFERVEGAARDVENVSGNVH